jgi:ribosomal protein RSM22 (predicted rRNA methylase)
MSMAKEEIKSYVEERMPFEYQKLFSVLDKIKRRGFALADKTENDRDKVIALYIFVLKQKYPQSVFWLKMKVC